MKILLIEDDAIYAKSLSKCLVSNGYTVEVASDGTTGLELARWHHDLIILDVQLDVQLPKLDSLNMCRQLRSQGIMTPILMLTTPIAPEEITKGLDSGADDYITKPCYLPELLARVRALLRRGKEATEPKLTWGKLTLDPALKEVTYAGEPIHLRPKEYSLLELFLRSPRQILDREMILDRLWTLDDSPTKFAVTNLIKDLRQRLHNGGMREEFIETVYGAGYRLKSVPNLQSVQARFHESIPSRIKELENWLTLKNYKRFQETAHKLAGTLGTFGYGQATEVARSMEYSEPDQYPRLIKALSRALTVPTKATYVQTTGDQVLLIAEDDTQLADHLSKALDDKGTEIHVVRPDQVLPWLKQFPKLSAILILLKSPQHLQLLTQIKNLAPNPPLVVIDYAQDTLDRRVEISSYKLDRYFSKNCSTQQIVDEIAAMVAVPTRPKIVIMDDDQFILDYLSEKLVPHYVTVISVNESHHIWSVLQQHHPDLLLLDIEIPHYNGKQLCQVIRQSEMFHKLPVIVITAHDRLQEELYALGATDVIIKPISDIDIKTRILGRVGIGK